MEDNDKFPPQSAIVSSPITWTSQLLSVLVKRKLKCHLLSPQSPRFKSLYQRLDEDDEYFSEVSPTSNIQSQQTNFGLSREVEKTLFDAFADNDFDDTLHLLIVEEEEEYNTSVDHDESRVLGIVFWRDVPSKEMSDWLNLSNAKDMDEVMRLLEHVEEKSRHNDLPFSLLQEESTSSPSLPTTETRKRQLSVVRQHSALSFLGNPRSRNHMDYNGDDTTSISSSTLPPTHAWIKIELLAVKKSFWGRRIGSLLLACCLYHAYMGNTIKSSPRLLIDADENNSYAEGLEDVERNLILANTADRRAIKGHHKPSSPPAQHCILHVAGGKNNIPALKLYDRFGFLPASHLFKKPNKDLYVLGDIGHSLERLFYASNR